MSDEPLKGFRFWLFSNEGGQNKLKSLYSDTFWTPKERFEAHCRSHSGHTEPERDCSCGTYAMRKPEQLGNEHPFNGDVIKDTGEFQLILPGVISLWGKVITHGKGYRAQYSYPYEFWIPEAMAPWVHGPLSEWGVDIVTVPSEEIELDSDCTCYRCRSFHIQTYTFEHGTTKFGAVDVLQIKAD